MIPLLAQPSERIRELLAGDPIVVVTANPVEYHGPHLSLLNDALISAGIARDVVSALGVGAVFAGDLPLGVEPCPGPGSRHTPYPVVRDALVECCRALLGHGAKRFLLGTFHGSPLHNLAVDDAVRFVEGRGGRAFAPLHVLLERLLDVSQVPTDDALAPLDEADRARARAELPMDLHAGFFETSLALHYAPDSVDERYREVPPCPPFGPDAKVSALARAARAVGLTRRAQELTFVAAALGWYALDPFPGYTGRPHLANARSGAAFAKLIVDDAVALARRVFVDGAPMPRPPLAWIGTISWGGRLGGAPHPKRHRAELTR